MSKFCVNCGNELDDNADVCPKCGKLVQYEEIKTNNVNNIVENKADKNATVGFVLGLVSTIAWFIPLFGFPVTICGIVFSAKGLKSKKNHTQAVVGLVFSIIFVIVTLVNSIVGVVMWNNIISNAYYDY